MSKDPEGWAFDFGCILHDNFNSDAVARIVVPFSAHGFRFAGTARPKTGFGMELLERLLFGSDSLWGGGVAHSVMILALVIALGIMLGKVKVAGVSLGVTGILFVGIAFSYFGMNIDEHLMHFLKEFGLILFVYSIGLQVGPGFFSSFRKGGVTLNKLAVLVVALGVVTTVALYYVTGLPMTTMVGVMSGAVTNTPGLGAAQQAFSDLHAGADAPDIATGYALAHPLGVIGAILTLLASRCPGYRDRLCIGLSARSDRSHPDPAGVALSAAHRRAAGGRGGRFGYGRAERPDDPADFRRNLQFRR